jgi:membrane associated rhomboid family serine protease
MITEFGKSALQACVFLLLLVVIELLDRAGGDVLYRLGVYPHHLFGLPGILFAPLIHGSWYHLLSNGFALLILLTALGYGYPRSRWPVLALIWLGSGAGVWLFGRESYHFGASGLTHGLMFFIFTSGILRRDRRSIALALIVFLVYGSMIWSIFPQEPHISYESHFFGAVCGVLGAFLFRHRDPVLPQKHYDWEIGNEENPDDDAVG